MPSFPWTTQAAQERLESSSESSDSGGEACELVDLQSSSEDEDGGDQAALKMPALPLQRAEGGRKVAAKPEVVVLDLDDEEEGEGRHEGEEGAGLNGSQSAAQGTGKSGEDSKAVQMEADVIEIE